MFAILMTTTAHLSLTSGLCPVSCASSPQTLCLVNEEFDRKKTRAEETSQWTTPAGFVYPKPKKTSVRAVP